MSLAKKYEVMDMIWEKLKGEGLSDIHSVAIMANLGAESGFDKGVTNSIGAFGLQQWLGPRKKALVAEFGAKPSLSDQLDFLVKEHKGEYRDKYGIGWNYWYGNGKRMDGFGYQPSREQFNNARDIYNATLMWNQGFGRPKSFEANNNKRLDLAKQIALRYGVDTSVKDSFSWAEFGGKGHGEISDLPRGNYKPSDGVDYATEHESISEKMTPTILGENKYKEVFEVSPTPIEIDHSVAEAFLGDIYDRIGWNMNKYILPVDRSLKEDKTKGRLEMLRFITETNNGLFYAPK